MSNKSPLPEILNSIEDDLSTALDVDPNNAALINAIKQMSYLKSALISPAPHPIPINNSELNLDFRELNNYLNNIYHQAYISKEKDSGNLWIAFIDRFNAFQKKIISYNDSITDPETLSNTVDSGEGKEAIAALEWLLQKSADKEIDMVDGEFYWSSDKDGEQPMDGKQIYSLFNPSGKQPVVPPMRWVKASEKVAGTGKEVYLKGCRIDKGFLCEQDGYIYLMRKTPFNDGERVKVSQWKVGHEELNEIYWLDEQSPANDGWIEIRVKDFVNQCRKETGESKALILEAWCQNVYKFDKEFIISYVKAHGRKF